MMDIKDKTAALFIMPRSSRDWVGAEALWITAAGWSAAAQRRFGKAWVMTTDRIAAPEEVIHYPLGVKAGAVATNKKGKLPWMPMFFKTFLKDILLWRRSRKWDVAKQAPWRGEKVAFVWQQHDLFAGPGRKIANALGVPLVTYVHAPVVWETGKWGVKRYLWGWFLERFAERKALLESDVVACVSEEVAGKLAAMGVDRSKILVSAMAVDQHLFDKAGETQGLRHSLGLENAFVVGWTGSFRSFHGLDLLVRSFKEVHQALPQSKLLLVGDGSERPGLEQLVQELGLKDNVVFAGRQPFAKIPSYVSVFDLAIVSARSAEGFHYSPLKLREYLAAGKPTLAPRAGEIPQMFRDDLHLKLFTAGDVKALASTIITLVQDPAKLNMLKTEGKKYALETSTWDYEQDKLITQYLA
jgi:glycosyltransferase involved in cell wall biosynthesis